MSVLYGLQPATSNAIDARSHAMSSSILSQRRASIVGRTYMSMTDHIYFHGSFPRTESGGWHRVTGFCEILSLTKTLLDSPRPRLVVHDCRVSCVQRHGIGHQARPWLVVSRFLLTQAGGTVAGIGDQGESMADHPVLAGITLDHDTNRFCLVFSSCNSLLACPREQPSGV